MEPGSTNHDGPVSKDFALVRDDRGRTDFDLYTAWSPRIREAYLSSGADGLIANYARGFVGADIEFVRDLPLRRLDLLDRGITDLTPLHDLGATLEELHVQSHPGSHIDLSLVPGLRVLSCAWDQVKDTIDRTDRLEELFLAPYPETDLNPISHLTSLRILRMKERPRVRSLAGVEAMPWLAWLGIYGSPIEDISALERLRSPILDRLDLASCRHIPSLDPVAGLHGLRELDLSEGGTLPSLGPIAALTRLERLYLYGSTKVADRDLSPLLGLNRMKDLRMKNRRHYTPSVNGVRAHLGLEQW